MTEFPYDIEQANAERGAQVIQIDAGKHVHVVALAAVICGICAGLCWWAISKQAAIADQYREDSLYLQDQYQKERNHIIELEARTKVLSDDLQELKNHERR